MTDTATAPTAHVDTFVLDRLPPPHLWPELDLSGIDGGYPARLNCAAELLDGWIAGGSGNRTAIHFPDGHWSYRELWEHANRIAHALRDDLGLVPGERVLLRAPNHPMLAAAWLGVLKAGGICVTTMPLLRPRELAQIAERARVRVALTDVRLQPELEEARAAAPTLERVVPFNTFTGDSLEAMLQRHPAEFDAVDTAATDPALIAFTSGTTGEPKGTVHFHRDVLASCDTYARHVLRAGPEDIFCGSPPLAFTFGLGGLVLFPLRVGAATLLLEQATPPHLLEGIERHRATICFTAPTAYRAMAQMLAGRDISSLRRCVSAGEALPLTTFQAWERATGLRIMDGIGSTEMLHIFIGSPEEEIRPGSTGRVVPGYRARVVDREGNELEPGTIGLLAVQGPTGCRYLDDPERQQSYVRDGWNFPGDAYRVDEEGFFWYQARADDMIISSGYNISGPEVENVLLEHAAVAECGVVGTPDPERGQVVTAYVVLRGGHEPGEALAEELQEFVKREIAPYKYPRRVEFVESLPRTQTGKLQRYRLREGAS